MNLSRKWLSDFVDVRDISNKDYCDRMTATGSKVEGVTVLGRRYRECSRRQNSENFKA